MQITADGWTDGDPVRLDALGVDLLDTAWEDDLSGLAPPPLDGWEAEAELARRDPVDQLVQVLRRVDRQMARALRLMAQAGPRDGLPVRREVALLANSTGAEVAFLDRAVEVLRPMPRTQVAFDAGLLSWAQVRGIILEARRLSVARRQVLDDLLMDRLDGRSGEPDRIVEVAGDLAARLDAEGQERLEEAQERHERVHIQPDFDGWGQLHGLLGPETTATVSNALDALADPPLAPDAPPATDEDGKVLPSPAQPTRSRAGQWAEALHPMACLVLGGLQGEGTSRRAQPRVTIIAPLTDLLPDTDTDAAGADGVGLLTSRLLLRRGNGRRRLTRALTRRLADTAGLVALFVDDHGMPVAIGDCLAPITPAMRRAVTARDQGCRGPGCQTPAEHCDVHHVVPREEDGATEVGNLILLCRPCHTRITRKRWHMTLHPDATVTTRIGRRTFTTRPRLTDPPRVTGSRPAG